MKMFWIVFILIQDHVFNIDASHDIYHTFWKRDTGVLNINLQTGFSDSNSNVGRCSLHCEQVTGCVSFVVDVASSTCTGYLETQVQLTTSLSSSQWYFSREIRNETTTTPVPSSNPGEIYSFTNCGKTGRTGPTLQECQTAYNTAWSTDINVFNVLSGVQQWTLPYDGSYKITAVGASGGFGDTTSETNVGSNMPGGNGAKVEGTFSLTAGTVLLIVCGQMGSNGTWSETGGGGGGSFVYTGNIGGNGLLIAAGGGGGGGEEQTIPGFDGSSTEQAVTYTGLWGNNSAGNGGIGYGGPGGSYVAAGAGWYSDGGTSVSLQALPGTRWVGGNEYVSSVYIAGAGGFGGGASGCYTNGGGSAGGYTGGPGVVSTTRTHWGGGGGGSYNGGTNKVGVDGFNNGQGYVTIEVL